MRIALVVVDDKENVSPLKMSSIIQIKDKNN